MKNINERIGALLLAVAVMIPLGLTGTITRVADFAGPAVISGMMAGVGLMVAGISIDMLKQSSRTGIISFAGALGTWVLFQTVPALIGNPHNLVYVIAVSVTLATVDFAFIQKDPKSGKRGRRINVFKVSKNAGYVGSVKEKENPKFWTKDYWEEFKLVKPKFSFYAFYFALAFISLNIGTNIAFGSITESFTSPPGQPPAIAQNMDHLTVINSLADIPSVLLGGAPVGAIISATAAAPAPVLAGVAMMLLCALLLLLGLMTKAMKYVPVQAIAGFLFIIGFFSTFLPNLRSSALYPGGNWAETGTAAALTAITKNPFIGLVGGILIRIIGVYFLGNFQGGVFLEPFTLPS